MSSLATQSTVGGEGILVDRVFLFSSTLSLSQNNFYLFYFIFLTHISSSVEDYFEDDSASNKSKKSKLGF